MNNKMLLKQARKMLKSNISESPTILNVLSQAMISDGKGGLMPDPYGTPTETQIKCRISHENGSVPKDSSSPIGLSTNLTRFILTDYETVITEGNTIDDYNGRNYRIGPVDPLIKFGGIIGYQATLIEG